MQFEIFIVVHLYSKLNRDKSKVCCVFRNSIIWLSWIIWVAED